MTDSFERWIMGMSEEDYEDWLEDDASDKQEEKALNIREPISDDEQEDLTREQESLPTTRDDEIREQVEQQSGRRGGIRGFFERLFRR